jgi:hypothetical protein
VVPDDQQQHDRADRGRRGPLDLPHRHAGERGQVGPQIGPDRAQVEPAQERHAQPVDERDRGQQDRIGVRGEDPDGDVDDQEDDEEHGHDDPDVGRDHIEHAGLDRGRVQQHNEHREDQHCQLGAAPRTRTPDDPGAGRDGRGEGGHNNVLTRRWLMASSAAVS